MGEGEVITVTPGLDHIAVFVRDGGIVPMTNSNTVAEGKYDLIIKHYGDKEASYRLYDDDGKTYDYERGAYSWRTVTIKRDKNGQLVGAISAGDKGKPNNIGKVSWEFITK